MQRRGNNTCIPKRGFVSRLVFTRLQEPITPSGDYISTMMLRRFAPVLAAFFAVNIAVQAAGAACVMPGEHTASGSQDQSSMMAGMSRATSPITDSFADQSRHGSPCDAPGVPANCASFAPCGSGLFGLAPESPATMQSGHAQPAALVVLAPASRLLLPELPPPRS